MYSAINKGLQLARGEVLAYLNSDDRYLPWTLQTAVQYLYAHPQTDIVYGDLLIADSNRFHLEFAPPFRLNLYLRTGWSPPQPSTFWRRRVFERLGGFREDLKFVGDWEYLLRAAHHGFHFKKVLEFLAVFRMHPASKTVGSHARMMQEMHEQIRQYAGGTVPRRHYLIERLYLFMWHRCYMAAFLASRALKQSGRRPLGWERLLSRDDLALASWRELLSGFMPIGRRGTDRWSLSANLDP
jgi:glycosyltransferase involved in cell wall biosynthesis